MRTVKDRIRHAISFEIIALFIVTPAGAWALGLPLFDIGVVAIGCATIAAGWNYLYNLLFDKAMMRFCGRVQKTVRVRLLHAVLFEMGLMVALVPLIAWYLDISFMESLLTDIGFSVFYVVYALLFNWAYDLIYPLPNPEPVTDFGP
jgi:uncharacterized membrane protein